MDNKKKLKGPWLQRFFIVFLSVVLGVLFFWLFGFLAEDIASLRGPDWAKVQAEYVDDDIAKKQKSLQETINGVKANIENKQEQRNLLTDSTDSLQNTIKQLLDIQKQSIEKNLDFPAESQKTLTESQALFLRNQQRYQELNNEIAELVGHQQRQEKELSVLSRQIEKQRDLARKEHNTLMKKHRLKLAVLKLAVLMPIFLISAWLFIKKRSGTFGPIIYALFIAVFLKTALVAHEHFPSRYFKYIAWVVITVIVLKLLVYLLKLIVSPKKDWLVKQYQEAYDKGSCPLCGKPIRIGPLRYVMGTKRKRTVLIGQGAEAAKQEIYTCPSCGTNLYEKCGKCSDIRHSLLPFCEHCGNEKSDLE